MARYVHRVFSDRLIVTNGKAHEQSRCFYLNLRSVSAFSIAAVLVAGTAARAETLDTLPFDQKLRLANAGDLLRKAVFVVLHNDCPQVRFPPLNALDPGQ